MTSETPLPRAPASKVVPYIEGEEAADRHARRKDAAEDAAADLGAWCRTRGISMVVRNDGHHFEFRAAGRLVEWWPSTGRVVYDRRYRRPRKAHDAEQLKRLLTGALLDRRSAR